MSYMCFKFQEPFRVLRIEDENDNENDNDNYYNYDGKASHIVKTLIIFFFFCQNTYNKFECHFYNFFSFVKKIVRN